MPQAQFTFPIPSIFIVSACANFMVTAAAPSSTMFCWGHDEGPIRHVDLQHIDNLPREKAFFKGPSPLLLASTSPEDLTFLLLGSDPNTSQVHLPSTCSDQLYHCTKSFLLLSAFPKVQKGAAR